MGLQEHKTIEVRQVKLSQDELDYRDSNVREVQVPVELWVELVKLLNLQSDGRPVEIKSVSVSITTKAVE